VYPDWTPVKSIIIATVSILGNIGGLLRQFLISRLSEKRAMLFPAGALFYRIVQIIRCTHINETAPFENEAFNEKVSNYGSLYDIADKKLVCST
jgi:hypothetical protein